MAEEAKNSTDANPGRNTQLREIAFKPESKKPHDISESEWRKARVKAGHMVVIRSHFKSIFLVPMALISAACAIWSMIDKTHNDALGLFWSFAFIFYMNMFVFEWSRAWTIALISGLIATVSIMFAVNGPSFRIFTIVYDWLNGLELTFSPGAYKFFTIFFSFCVFLSWLKTRLNFVVMEHNEMQVYRNALVGDRERISMLNPSIEVIVPDMLEYWHPFYRAGTVIVHAPNKTIILDNVLNIRRIENLTDRVGSALTVRVEKDSDQRKSTGGSSNPS